MHFRDCFENCFGDRLKDFTNPKEQPDGVEWVLTWGALLTYRAYSLTRWLTLTVLSTYWRPVGGGSSDRDESGRWAQPWKLHSFHFLTTKYKKAKLPNSSKFKTNQWSIKNSDFKLVVQLTTTTTTNGGRHSVQNVVLAAQTDRLSKLKVSGS